MLWLGKWRHESTAAFDHKAFHAAGQRWPTRRPAGWRGWCSPPWWPRLWVVGTRVLWSRLRSWGQHLQDQTFVPGPGCLPGQGECLPLPEQNPCLPRPWDRWRRVDHHQPPCQPHPHPQSHPQSQVARTEAVIELWYTPFVPVFQPLPATDIVIFPWCYIMSNHCTNLVPYFQKKPDKHGGEWGNKAHLPEAEDFLDTWEFSTDDQHIRRVMVTGSFN